MFITVASGNCRQTSSKILATTVLRAPLFQSTPFSEQFSVVAFISIHVLSKFQRVYAPFNIGTLI